MLPGKRYKPEDFLWIAWNRKWYAVVSTVVIGTGVFVWASQLPNRYRAETTVAIVPQRVPENYVQSTITSDISERLQLMSQQILSRTRLEQLILEFNLYSQERATTVMADVVEQMRRDVNVAIARRRTRRDETNSFTVSYQSSNARTAFTVTERLGALFVQENLQDRALLADSTTQFLQAQLEEARRRLVEHEQSLEAFRRRNAGRLPSQSQSNLQLMQTTQNRLIALSQDISRDRDRLTALETAIASTPTVVEPVTAVPRPTPARAGANAPSAAQLLEAARTAFAAMELRLKPAHPDLADAKRKLAELEAKAETEALQQPVSAPTETAPATTGPSAPRQNRTAALQLEVTELRQRLESRKQQEAQLQKLMTSYAARVEATPAVEVQLTELTRDYSTLQEQYTTLLRRNEESKLAASLERRQIGEQFRVIDSARLPERPISPNRLRLNAMGLLAGLGFGLALIALLEYRDTTLKTDDDVVTSLALPVLAIIPVMSSADERRRIKRRRIVLALSASAASVLVVAVLIAWRLDVLIGLVR
jgi:polysaccharide chain length determinant protein (PEP-CTERM system associated)